MRTHLSSRIAVAAAAAKAFSGATAEAPSAPVVETARDARLTHRGRPLHSFDHYGRGDANGEGVKDVGTWHAVVPSG